MKFNLVIAIYFIIAVLTHPGLEYNKMGTAYIPYTLHAYVDILHIHYTYVYVTYILHMCVYDSG